MNICSSTRKSLQTKDLMLSGKSFIKIRNMIGLKTKPCGTPGNIACVHDSQLVCVDVT